MSSPQAPKLIDQVRNYMRLHHYSLHTVGSMSPRGNAVNGPEERQGAPAPRGPHVHGRQAGSLPHDSDGKLEAYPAIRTASWKLTPRFFGTALSGSSGGEHLAEDSLQDAAVLVVADFLGTVRQ